MTGVERDSQTCSTAGGEDGQHYPTLYTCSVGTHGLLSFLPLKI